jgi:hypothetical protein
VTAVDLNRARTIRLRASPLAFAVALIWLMTPLTLLMMQIDQRTLASESIWLKPLKFQLALSLHGATLALITRCLPGTLAHSRTVRWMNLAVAATLIYEVLFIATQAARGVRSHFNSASLFDVIGGKIMAGGAGVLTLAPALIGFVLVWRLIRYRSTALPLHLGIALGLILSGYLGGQTGGAIGANQGPLVGAAVGPFMPLTGWSTTGGDLRIAHFMGLHAMQALPITGMIAGRILPRRFAFPAVAACAALWTATALWLLALAQAGSSPM